MPPSLPPLPTNKQVPWSGKSLVTWLLVMLLVNPLQLLWRFVLKPTYHFLLKPLYNYVLVPLYPFLLKPFYNFVLLPLHHHLLSNLWNWVLRPALRSVGKLLYLLRSPAQTLGSATNHLVREIADVIYHTNLYLRRQCNRLRPYVQPISRTLWTYVISPPIKLVGWTVRQTWRVLVWEPVKFICRTCLSPPWRALMKLYAEWTRRGFTEGRFTLGIHPGKPMTANGGAPSPPMASLPSCAMHLFREYRTLLRDEGPATVLDLSAKRQSLLPSQLHSQVRTNFEK
jgi:hypothetical protein